MSETAGETRRLTLREAADRTGIPLDALRKRVYRGTIPAEKIDGQYTVLETDLAAIAPGETAGETVLGRGSDRSGTADFVRTESERSTDPLALDYIASLKEEIAFLRSELETRTDELQRRDVLLREALGRIPQLTAGEPARSSDTGSVDSARPRPSGEATERAEAHRPSVVASLVRRVFGRG